MACNRLKPAGLVANSVDPDHRLHSTCCILPSLLKILKVNMVIIVEVWSV